ncbi:MAG TPA: class I SAM-dependent methyltransferase [Tepidisphaeraceae bacterium]|nr:class I SAM-dependent methyltransferase [Tepidisphaeraceae bacterium]
MQRQPEPELMDLPEEARAYARAKFPDVMESVVNRLLELAAARGGSDGAAPRMVDLGTGPGTIPVMVARQRPQWDITAVDAAKAMTMIAGVSVKMAGVSDRVRVHLADAKSTGLPDGGFDIVFCASLLHHMPDPTPLWREIKRLAAPGALIFVRDLMRPESESAARRLVDTYAAEQSELLQEEFYRSLLSAFTVDEVRGQLAAAGLASLNVEPVGDRNLDVFGTAK